jgi:GDPmannose 4,6-dehydratase
MNIAFITGITGQDGSYLSEFLLEKGYIVCGIVRRHSTTKNTYRIDKILNELNLFYGDITDSLSLYDIFDKILTKYPNYERFEVYHLAAQSHVKVSFEMPEYTTDVDALGTLRLLDVLIKKIPNDKCRFYQASTSELYGDVLEVPQSETTPFNPQSPYAVAKLYSYWIVKNYRKSYHMFASNGILFNHTSPRRGETFVCYKIARGVQRIMDGTLDVLELGNLNAQRDLGHAKEYVEGMWKILQHYEPGEFVLATGKMYSVRQLVEFAFEIHGKTVFWEGQGKDEKGFVDGRVICRVNERYYRPAEVEELKGDARKAKRELGWSTTISIKEILKEIMTKKE